MVADVVSRLAGLLGRGRVTGVPLGYEWDTQKGRYGKRLTFDGHRAPHLLVIGPNGSGKGTRLLIPALLQLSGRSIVVIDPKGELAAVTAAWRRTVGDVVVLNPFGLHVERYADLASAGFNPLASLDETAPTFYDDAKGLAEALITVEGDTQRHFPESARGLITAAMMWERKLNGVNASLKRVRMMLTEKEEWAGEGGTRRLVRGLRRTAELMCDAAKQFPDQGGWQIASLASRFVADFNNETRGIQSTLDTQTGWILSEPLAGDLESNGIDFRGLKQRPSTVYVILPGERLREHSTWLRLVIAWALRGLYSPGGVPVLFVIDEFAQLGRLGPIEDALGQGRGYGIALLPVLQDINQLRDLYHERAETFAGMSGAVFGFPPNDMNTAEWMSKRSGEEIIIGMSAGESDTGEGPRTNYHPEKRPRYAPHELFNLPEGHGLIWTAGRDAPQPVYAPPYWDIARCKKRARPNPYHSPDRPHRQADDLSAVASQQAPSEAGEPPEPVGIGWRLTARFPWLGINLLMVLTGLIIANAKDIPTDEQQTGIPMAIWFGIGVPFGLWQLTIRNPVITVSQEGIRDKRISLQFIPWDYITRIDIEDTSGKEKANNIYLTLDPQYWNKIKLRFPAGWLRRRKNVLKINVYLLKIRGQSLLATATAHAQWAAKVRRCETDFAHAQDQNASARLLTR